MLKALKRIPTIGEVTAQKLMQKFGDGFLASMLGGNIHECQECRVLIDGRRRLACQTVCQSGMRVETQA